MVRNTLSKKQQDLQLAEVRKVKIKELETEYHEYQELLKAVGWDSQVGAESLENYVERRIRDWDDEQPVVVTGIYYDREKVIATYQHKFVCYLRECAPNALEELRDLVPLFNRFFGDNKEKYLLIFFREKMEFYELNYSFERTVDLSILQTVVFQLKPNKYENRTYDYLWGDYKILLYFLYLLLVPAKDNTHRQQLLSKTIDLLKEAIQIQYQFLPEAYDESVLQNIYNNSILNVLKEFVLGEQREPFLTMATLHLKSFLKDITAPNEPDISAFIELQFEVLSWAERHHLSKDWLLRYAYFFISEMSKNPETDLAEIVIPPLNSRSLAAGPLEFLFNGWMAGDESKEDYERRATKAFNSRLSDYFSSVGRSFKLNAKKRLTKPIDYDRVKWLIQWTVLGQSKEEILNEIDQDYRDKGTEKYYSISTIDKAFTQFKKHSLPVRE